MSVNINFDGKDVIKKLKPLLVPLIIVATLLLYFFFVFLNNFDLFDDYHDYRLRKYFESNPGSSYSEAENYLTYQTDYKNKKKDILFKPYFLHHKGGGIYKFSLTKNLLFYLFIFFMILFVKRKLKN